MIIKKLTLKRWVDGYGVQLDQEILAEVGAEADTIFEMVVNNGRIILTPKAQYPATLEALFKDYVGEPLDQQDKFLWDEPQGAEVL